MADDGQLHHHHAGDPEEDDVKPGDEDGGGEVFFEFLSVLGPAEGTDGPEAGGEPGVEDVGVAPDWINQLGTVLSRSVIAEARRQHVQRGLTAFDLDSGHGGQGCRKVGQLATKRIGDIIKLCAASHQWADMSLVQEAQHLSEVKRAVPFVVLEVGRTEVEAIPNRDLMPPPELAGDAPGLDVFQPVEIDLPVLLGHDVGVAGTHRLNRGAHDFVGVDEPLVRQHRFDHDL